MDKYLIREHSTIKELEDTFEEPIKPFVLGVIGNSSSSFWNKESLLTHVVEPLFNEEQKTFDTIIISNEGHTSMLLESWANHKHIQTTIYNADWKMLGRRARVMRDSRIMKESTHLLFFLGTRSDYYEKMAIREVKKGRTVYTIDSKTHELVQWVL